MHIVLFYLSMMMVSSMTILRLTMIDESLILLCYLLGFFVLISLVVLMGKETLVSRLSKEERVELIRANGYLVVNGVRDISFTGISRSGIKTITINKQDRNNKLMLFYDASEYVIIRQIYEKSYAKWLGLRGFTSVSVRYEYELHLSSEHDILHNYGVGQNYDCVA